MKIMLPTKTRSMPPLFTPFFQHPTGLQKSQFMSTLRRRDIAVVCPRTRTIACSFDKYSGYSNSNSNTVEYGKTPLILRPASDEYVEEAIEAVKNGKVISVPTDTLYGFACDACSTEAVHNIYSIKGRKHTKPLAICVGDVHEIHRFATTDHLPRGLLDSLLPGPVTLVLRRGSSSVLDMSLNSGFESVGVRVPDCGFIRAVARGSGTALALTSANLSGKPSSVDVRDFENLWGYCAYVYDGGVLPKGRAGSTVVDLSEVGRYRILRAGSAGRETIAILERYALVGHS